MAPLKELGADSIPSEYHSLPVVIVNNIGRKTGAIRKTPLMKVIDGNSYVLVASMGGAPKHPLWYYNLLENPKVEIRDHTKIHSMIAVEIRDAVERKRYGTLRQKPTRHIKIINLRLIDLFLSSWLISLSKPLRGESSYDP